MTHSLRHRCVSLWRIALFGVLACLVAVTSVPVLLHGADKAPFTIAVFREVDNNGPYTEAATIRDSDYAVLVELAWEKPLTAAARYTVRWIGPDGKAYYESAVDAAVQSEYLSTGLRVQGFTLSKMKGQHTVAILPVGETQPLAQATFTLAPAARDPQKPRFTGALSANLDEDLVPLGKTNSFFGDTGSIWVSYTAKAMPAKDHTLIAKIFNEKNELVLTGSPTETDGESDMYGTGFYLAGRAWAKEGGKFTLRVFWDEDPDPVVSLPFTVKTANRWALLIGIADYPGEKNDLPGCDLDIEAVQEMLTTTYGFDKQHITTLMNLNATKANIVKVITELAAKAKKDDAVYIHYSGHGGQVPDLDGDEEDGWDETLVPAEPIAAMATTETDIARYLTDDETAKLLERFVTNNVTVVFDSCHSGTAVRNIGPEDITPPTALRRARSVNAEFSRELIRKAENARQEPRADSDPAGMDIGKRYVFLAAARPWELASGDDDGGFFTLSLVYALTYADGQSWDQIMTGVRDEVMDINFGQNPAAEGAVRRLPFSLAEADEDAPYIRPSLAVAGAAEVGAKEDKPTRLNTGTAKKHLALIEAQSTVYLEQIGALYDVYPAGDQTMNGKAKGQVRITGDRLNVAIRNKKGEEVYDETSTVADILSGTVDRGDRLVAVAVPVPSATPKVGFYIGKDSAESERKATQTISDPLRRDAGIRIMERGTFAEMDYIVETRLQNKVLTALIWSPGGWMMADFAGTERELSDKVKAFISKRHQQYTRFVRVSNPSPAYALRADLVDGDTPRKAGGTVTIKVTGAAAGYLTALTSAGFEAPQLIATSESVIPAEQAYTLSVKLPDKAGRYPVKVISTERPLDGKAIANAVAASRTDALLAALVSAVGNGGGAPNALATAGWADTTVWIDVQ